MLGTAGVPGKADATRCVQHGWADPQQQQIRQYVRRWAACASPTPHGIAHLQVFSRVVRSVAQQASPSAIFTFLQPKCTPAGPLPGSTLGRTAGRAAG